MTNTLYILGSVFLVSLVAFVGILTLAFRKALLKKSVLYLVSFSAGALFGDTFIHILPHTAEIHGMTHMTGVYLLSGLVISFVVESFIHWHHHHHYDDECDNCVDPEAYMILIGDAVHNFIDGVVIAASYLASFSIGLATTIAVMLHELPQEIGDFGVLIHGGFTRKRALFYNFVSALTSFLGAGLVLFFSINSNSLNSVLLPFAAGGFVYIAGSDLLPKIKNSGDLYSSTSHITTFILGTAVMYLITLL
ncbi:MAG: ZIP family metal transporter [Candidatus Nanohaloarchaea archaeon]|nr:ZIP family metal transporter [Candidatus Nanohaloarchaea archaeon]